MTSLFKGGDAAVFAFFDFCYALALEQSAEAQALSGPAPLGSAVQPRDSRTGQATSPLPIGGLS